MSQRREAISASVHEKSRGHVKVSSPQILSWYPLAERLWLEADAMNASGTEQAKRRKNETAKLQSKAGQTPQTRAVFAVFAVSAVSPWRRQNRCCAKWESPQPPTWCGPSSKELDDFCPRMKFAISERFTVFDVFEGVYSGVNLSEERVDLLFRCLPAQC